MGKSIDVNAYLIQARGLERVADDHEENGLTSTAADYREAASSIRELAGRIRDLKRFTK